VGVCDSVGAFEVVVGHFVGETEIVGVFVVAVGAALVGEAETVGDTETVGTAVGDTESVGDLETVGVPVGAVVGVVGELVLTVGE